MIYFKNDDLHNIFTINYNDKISELYNIFNNKMCNNGYYDTYKLFIEDIQCFYNDNKFTISELITHMASEGIKKFKYDDIKYNWQFIKDTNKIQLIVYGKIMAIKFTGEHSNHHFFIESLIIDIVNNKYYITNYFIKIF